MKTILLSSLLLAAPLRAENAFMGHYGYMLSYSDAYSAKTGAKAAAAMANSLKELAPHDNPPGR